MSRVSSSRLHVSVNNQDSVNSKYTHFLRHMQVAP